MALWKLRMGVPRATVFHDVGYTEDDMRDWALVPEDYQATPGQLWPSAAKTPEAADTAAAEETPDETADEPTTAPPSPGNTPPVPPPKAPSGNPPPPPMQK